MSGRIGSLSAIVSSLLPVRALVLVRSTLAVVEMWEALSRSGCSSRRIASACALLLLTCVVSIAHAPTAVGQNIQISQGSGVGPEQMPPQFKETWKKSEDLRPKPSTDTTPVPLRVGHIEYQVPRNYFRYYGFLNEIDVSYPDFQPLTPTNAQCFRPSAHPEEVGCSSIGFSFSGPNGPTLRQMFENSKRSFRSTTPKEGPHGYQYYEIGPENARLEIYTKETAENGFIMLQRNVGSDPKAAVWSDVFPLDDSNFAHFFFRAEQLKDIVDIQSRMRRLMASFPARGIGK